MAQARQAERPIPQAAFLFPAALAAALVLGLIEDDVIDKDLSLENPVLSFRKVSRDLSCRETLKLKDGRELTCDLPHFPGMPQQPLNHAQLHEKFTTTTKGVLGARAEKVFADFSAIEKVANMREVI